MLTIVSKKNCIALSGLFLLCMSSIVSAATTEATTNKDNKVANNASMSVANSSAPMFTFIKTKQDAKQNIKQNTEQKDTPAKTNTAITPSSAQSIQPTVTTTQLELEISKGSHYSVFSLTNPPRIAIDVKGNATTTEFDKASLANTPIKRIRSAKHEDNRLRIVFDLKQDVAFKVQETTGNSANSVKVLIGLTTH